MGENSAQGVKTDGPERFVWDYYFKSQQAIAKSLEFSMFHADESVGLFRDLSPERQSEVLTELGYYPAAWS